MQFQGKSMVQTQENDKKTHFGPNLGPLDPNPVRQKFFNKSMASSVTRYHGQLSSCKISEKTNDPILREFRDGQTDGQTDRETDRRARVISLDAVRETSSVKNVGAL